ncbi:nucleoside-triphosphatase KNAG_0C03770 [Huiozyma naganishii CBS 8797]|uniref:Adenylate kinase isoenzyme 6 homolog n=1 Tax=Huiozyma naganishii (strain ATCC MYA-139 / BCRC 22969 / CBS 8797 / KCTC 17520 / NBRC 10181 / NCYC 3082 / Yp74L-3) TaxID=1071383 RepID=J7S627_HUIN7|nr:hypothetical protein KNAG_0C03770 [Kazachstania naganishii CBS 8797]CCK69481.1 hypothetical protein KNAG_0C03770 [Kazachstania naganishii CBS 8797]
MGESRRLNPNILVTGTPGTGKSTTCELLLRNLPDYTYYNISDFAAKNKCYDGYDEARKSHIVDEDKLLDELEPLLHSGGNIIDWHVNDVFPERLIDLVAVLRCDSSVLFDRLNKREYHSSKIDENMDAEIMGVVLQDALDSYEEQIVVELQSDDTEQMAANVDRVVTWTTMWKEQHPEGVTNELSAHQAKKERNDESEEGDFEEQGSDASSESESDSESEGSK